MNAFSTSVVSMAEVLQYLETDRYMQKPDASNYIGLSIRTLESHLAEIPHYRVGGRILFKRSELDHWVQAHREETDVDVDALANDALKAVMG